MTLRQVALEVIDESDNEEESRLHALSARSKSAPKSARLHIPEQITAEPDRIESKVDVESKESIPCFPDLSAIRPNSLKNQPKTSERISVND
jgi:hypothetical protein